MEILVNQGHSEQRKSLKRIKRNLTIVKPEELQRESEIESKIFFTPAILLIENLYAETRWNGMWFIMQLFQRHHEKVGNISYLFLRTNSHISQLEHSRKGHIYHQKHKELVKFSVVAVAFWQKRVSDSKMPCNFMCWWKTWSKESFRKNVSLMITDRKLSKQFSEFTIIIK